MSRASITEDTERGILIIDSDLYDTQHGHFFNYDHSIVTELYKRETFVKVLCSKHLNIEFGEPGFVPVLKLVPSDLKVIRSRYKIINLWLVVKMQCLLTVDFIKYTRKFRHSIKAVFFPNIDFFNALPIILSVLFLPRNVKAILFYRYTNKSIHFGRKVIYMVYKTINLLLRSKIKKNRALWVTDSTILAEEGMADFSCHITVLPIPHTFELDIPASQEHFKNHKNTVRIYLPGKSNLGKGLASMLQAIEHFFATTDFSCKVVFLIQNFKVADNFKKFANDFDFAEIEKKIKELSSVGHIELLNPYLTSDEYYEKLATSDIILLPYRVEGYVAQTSGIFTEALAFGKPVIVTKQTWLSLQITNGYGAGVTFDGDDYESMAAAIQSMINNLEQYKRDAVEKSVHWRECHNALSFTDRLLALAV